MIDPRRSLTIVFITIMFFAATGFMAAYGTPQNSAKTTGSMVGPDTGSSIHLNVYRFIHDVEVKIIDGVRLICLKNGTPFGKAAFSKYNGPPSKGMLWLKDVENYENLHNTIVIAWKQLDNLAGRLDSIKQSKAELKKKYGEKYITPKLKKLDQDAQYLSKLGWQLIKATRSFYPAAKDIMSDVDITKARQKALEDLATFNQDMEKFKSMKIKALDENLKKVVTAMKKLEQAVRK